MPRGERVLKWFIWEGCQEMYGHYVYKAPWYVRYMLSADAYMIYVDGEKGIIAVILHDIGMCRGLEVALVDYACVWLIIHWVVWCCMLTRLLYYILSTLSITCMMIKLLFLFWIDHPKTCIISSFIELCSLCS